MTTSIFPSLPAVLYQKESYLLDLVAEKLSIIDFRTLCQSFQELQEYWENKKNCFDLDKLVLHEWPDHAGDDVLDVVTSPSDSQLSLKEAIDNQRLFGLYSRSISLLPHGNGSSIKKVEADFGRRTYCDHLHIEHVSEEDVFQLVKTFQPISSVTLSNVFLDSGDRRKDFLADPAFEKVFYMDLWFHSEIELKHRQSSLKYLGIGAANGEFYKNQIIEFIMDWIASPQNLRRIYVDYPLDRNVNETEWMTEIVTKFGKNAAKRTHSIYLQSETEAAFLSFSQRGIFFRSVDKEKENLLDQLFENEKLDCYKRENTGEIDTDNELDETHCSESSGDASMHSEMSFLSLNGESPQRNR